MMCCAIKKKITEMYNNSKESQEKPVARIITREKNVKGTRVNPFPSSEFPSSELFAVTCMNIFVVCKSNYSLFHKLIYIYIYVVLELMILMRLLLLLLNL